MVCFYAQPSKLPAPGPRQQWQSATANPNTIVLLHTGAPVELPWRGRVPAILHTPLMSGANAIHGIILVGAVIVAGQAESIPVLVVALIAVLLATVNLVGGFVVTDRMLEMFGGRRAPGAAAAKEGAK